MTDLQTKLVEIFCDNFVSYYRAHSCHLNITGRNFTSDHKLLQKIYEDAQENIDTIGEFIRTVGVTAPETVGDILAGSVLGEETADGNADSMLAIVLDAQEYMMMDYKELFDIATEATDQDIANYAADRLGAHSKFAWMLKSTLES
jgi:starvation-inducible DNA-binding protein